MKINKKFNNISVQKKISKLNSFIKHYIKHNYYVLDISNQDKINLYYIQLD